MWWLAAVVDPASDASFHKTVNIVRLWFYYSELVLRVTELKFLQSHIIMVNMKNLG